MRDKNKLWQYILVTAFLALKLFVDKPIYAQEDDSKLIALSFDDAPRKDSFLYTGIQRTKNLIFQLKAARVSSAGFLCNTHTFDAEYARQRLQWYGEAGHIIANHTHSHKDLHKVSANEFIADIDLSHELLKDLTGFRRYFRFPFLHEGEDAEKRDRIRDHLKAIGYQHAYVTIDTYDWYLNKKIADAYAKGIKPNYAKLRDLYLKVILDSVAFYYKLGLSISKNPIPHVLLLHENDLAAYFIKDLVDALREQGFSIIPFEQAYRSGPLLGLEPKTLRAGQGLVAALAVDQGYDQEIVSPTESEQVIDDLLAKYLGIR